MDMNRFFFDPLTTWYGGARYVGHKWVRDKEDLLREAREAPDSAGWNVEAIRQLAEDAGTESLPERERQQSGDIKRKEIVGYEVWVPEKQMRSSGRGFNGAIYTLAASQPSDDDKQQVAFIREPRPYFGPAWGPYTLYGAYPVPLDPWPMAPFAATYLQQRDLNDIVRAAVEAMRKYKRVVFVSDQNPDLARKAKDSEDAFVIPVKGFKKEDIVQYEFGGLTTQHVQQMEQALSRLDRNTGINQPERGNITGATATEIAKADAASQESIAFVKQEFTDATIQVLESVSWFMWHDDRVKFPLGEEAQEALEMGEPWYFGGGAAEGESFEDLELEIEPYSMEHANQALLRAQYAEMVELVMNAATIIPQSPFYDWKRIFEKGGEILNDPTFADFYLADVAQQYAAQMLAAEQGLQTSSTAPAGREERLAQRGFTPQPSRITGKATNNRQASVRGAA
jgi:hypothetical protein